MKGIILAAGKGTRLGPATQGIGSKGAGVSKGLLPTGGKPNVYYSLADLITAGIRDIVVIAAPNNVHQYEAMLCDGSELGISLSYLVQDDPRGIAEAFLIAEEFIGSDSVALTFSDNIFVGDGFNRTLKNLENPDGAMVFARYVRNPWDYGVVDIDKEGNALSLVEKPDKALYLNKKPNRPPSHLAVPGMYFYDSSVIEVARGVTPSARGELEITSVNEAFMHQGRLKVTVLDSDTDWFDTGTNSSQSAASNHILDFEEENERLHGSPEAAAFLAGFITADQLCELAEPLLKSDYYGEFLVKLANNGHW